MAGLIKDSVNEKLDTIVTACFAGNRLFDRAMSQLDVKFAMNKTASILHPKLAHLPLALADKISDYQSSRNMQTVYGLTPRDATDYNSPVEIFDAFVRYANELEFVVKEAYVMAVDEDDCFTHTFLQTFMMDLISMTKQCLLLQDKANLYANNWMQFDHNIEDFIVL